MSEVRNVATDMQTALFNAGAKIAQMEMLLDLKLPVDVKFQNGTNKAGTSVRTLALRIQSYNSAAKFDRVGGDE